MLKYSTTLTQNGVVLSIYYLHISHLFAVMVLCCAVPHRPRALQPSWNTSVNLASINALPTAFSQQMFLKLAY